MTASGSLTLTASSPYQLYQHPSTRTRCPGSGPGLSTGLLQVAAAPACSTDGIYAQKSQAADGHYPIQPRAPSPQTQTQTQTQTRTLPDTQSGSVRTRGLSLSLSIRRRSYQHHHHHHHQQTRHDPGDSMLTDAKPDDTLAALSFDNLAAPGPTTPGPLLDPTLEPNSTPATTHPPIYGKQRQRHVASPIPQSRQDQAQPSQQPHALTAPPQHQQTPTTQQHHPPTSALRKTSPGLAARLKALGFGNSNKSPDPSPSWHSRIGRLDEEQLRQLDEKHQTGSLSSIISRRGRPWKGATATASQSAAGEPDLPHDHTSLLPVIVATEPLTMNPQDHGLAGNAGNEATVSSHDPYSSTQQSERPPTPPPKSPPPPQTPPPNASSTDLSATTPSNEFPGLGAYFTPGQNRPGSIYTLSRASFANQLAQLTSLQLPDAESLSSHVSAMPTAQVASKALINAADQIRSWIAKATDVIEGLDSEDDVEWAAAGGREGLAEVENAINRFEELIHAYVGAIEELQGRKDIADVPAGDLKRAVTQMEIILDEWTKIRLTLNTVRGQVEIAMEWEELWNNVLGDIQGEMDELGRLVFEMEERRHKGAAPGSAGDNVDIGDLETIVEDTPPQANRLQAPSNRFSMPAFPMSPTSPGTPTLSADDSSLLALFARMQPLRASLDFLPMRLSVFEARAEKSFPTACEELEMRRVGLDGTYKKLEKDAESLRKELGEDRWVIVFRGAGRQALKMHESVERSLLKAREAVDAGQHLTNQPAMMKKIESYEAKKTHYGPAIERVLSIIDSGVKDRLTVNGEVLRLHADMERKWTSLKEQMSDTDALLNDILTANKGQQFRDSISSMVSNAPSTAGSGHETPGSSPPSSVIMTSLGFDPKTPVPKTSKARSSSNHSSVTSRRVSSLPAPTSQTGKRPLASRLSTIAGSSTTNSPAPISRLQRPSSSLPQRPRWNSSTVHPDTGHNFKPLSATTPSPYAKRTPNPQRSTSAMSPSPAGTKLPSYQSRLQRAASESPRTASASKNLSPGDTTPSKRSTSRLASFRERLASPGPYSQQTLAKPRLSSQSSSSSTSANRRASMQPLRPALAVEESQASRPASSLASSSRRSSFLPQPKDSGRQTPVSLSRLGMRRESTTESREGRPKWRP